MRASLSDDPLAPTTWRAFIRSARRIARGVRAALDRAAPDVVVLCNGLFLFESIAWAICRERGIDVVTYERGFIKETLVFRRNDVCLTPMDELWATFADQPLTDDETQTLDRYSKIVVTDGARSTATGTTPTSSDHRRSRPGRLVALFPISRWDSA